MSSSAAPGAPAGRSDIKAAKPIRYARRRKRNVHLDDDKAAAPSPAAGARRSLSTTVVKPFRHAPLRQTGGGVPGVDAASPPDVGGNLLSAEGNTPRQRRRSAASASSGGLQSPPQTSIALPAAVIAVQQPEYWAKVDEATLFEEARVTPAPILKEPDA